MYSGNRVRSVVPVVKVRMIAHPVAYNDKILAQRSKLYLIFDDDPKLSGSLKAEDDQRLKYIFILSN